LVGVTIKIKFLTRTTTILGEGAIPLVDRLKAVASATGLTFLHYSLTEEFSLIVPPPLRGGILRFII